MYSISARSGISKPFSRQFKSRSVAFLGFVMRPNTTRCNIQSMYTAAQITPVPASIVTIQGLPIEFDVQLPNIIRNSPTKPFRNGSPIEANEVITRNVEYQGIE